MIDDGLGYLIHAKQSHRYDYGVVRGVEFRQAWFHGIKRALSVFEISMPECFELSREALW